jgi:hyperosmotically inducible periplasmic protein
MLRKLSVLFCGAAVVFMTAGAATAQSATQEAKDKTASAAKKTGQVVSDAEITTAVKTKFLADSKVGGLKIDVDTDHGIVTLTGPVHSVAEKNEAVRLARNTHGVKSVVSKLTVETAATTGRDESKVTKETKEAAKDTKDATKDAAHATKEKTKDAAHATKEKSHEAKEATTDASITGAVKSKLLGDTKVGGLDINVDTKDNVVTLTGKVHSAAEKTEAVRLAKTTTGVKRVVDNLTIEPKK